MLVAKISKLCAALLITLEYIHNFFDGAAKLFSDLYLAKFLDTSTKSFHVQCHIHAPVVSRLI